MVAVMEWTPIQTLNLRVRGSSPWRLTIQLTENKQVPLTAYCCPVVLSLAGKQGVSSRSGFERFPNRERQSQPVRRSDGSRWGSRVEFSTRQELGRVSAKGRQDLFSPPNELRPVGFEECSPAPRTAGPAASRTMLAPELEELQAVVVSFRKTGASTRGKWSGWPGSSARLTPGPGAPFSAFRPLVFSPHI